MVKKSGGVGQFFVLRDGNRSEDAMWTDLSLASAMRGMEEEDTPYALTDIKESFR